MQFDTSYKVTIFIQIEVPMIIYFSTSKPLMQFDTSYKSYYFHPVRSVHDYILFNVITFDAVLYIVQGYYFIQLEVPMIIYSSTS